MKAITLIQPWASLIMDGRKTVETRSWPTSYRGPIAIHAGKKLDKAACREFGYHYPDSLPLGAVLGTAALVDCVKFPCEKTRPDEYGDFSPGRYGFILENVVEFDAAVAARGSLGLWDWEESE